MHAETMRTDLDLSDNDLLARTRQFAQDVVAVQAGQWERERRMARDAIKQAASIGLCGIETPVEYGGLGRAFSVKCRIAEILAAADYAFAFSLINTQNIANKLARHAPPAIRAQYVPGLLRGDLMGCTALTEPGMGSDFAAIETLATRTEGGWRLDGRKAWITNAVEVDVVMLYAQTQPGAGAAGIAGFLVDARRAGFVREPGYELAGQHAIGAGGFVLDGYIARDADMLHGPGTAFKAALTSINGARTYVAAMCCGMVGEALRIALEYGESRQTFGKPLADHQGWRWRLAEASAELLSCQMMVREAARQIDAGQDAQMLAAQAKLLATRMAERQLVALSHAMGAEGLRDGYPFGRHIVGALVAGFTDGSTEMLLERIAAGLRKERTTKPCT